MRQVARSLLSLLYPPSCYGCDADIEDGSFCAECWRRIPALAAPLCELCGLPFRTPGDASHLCGACIRRQPHYDAARACTIYDANDDGSPLRACLHAYKYQRRAELAAPLARILRDRCPFAPGDYELCMPVPLHRQRLRWRGFNQALLLLRPLARAARLTIDPFSLVRIRPTPPQVELSGLDRRRNVARAFAVTRPDLVRRRAILLVDDVLTTGSTVDECAKALKRAGAAHVDVLVLARAVVS